MDSSYKYQNGDFLIIIKKRKDKIIYELKYGHLKWVCDNISISEVKLMPNLCIDFNENYLCYLIMRYFDGKEINGVYIEFPSIYSSHNDTLKCVIKIISQFNIEFVSEKVFEFKPIVNMKILNLIIEENDKLEREIDRLRINNVRLTYELKYFDDSIMRKESMGKNYIFNFY